MKRCALILTALLLSALGVSQTPATVDAITFYDQPNVLYLPAKDAAKLLGWRLGLGHDGKTVYLNQKPVRSRVRELADGSSLVSLSELKRRGLSVTAQGKLFKVRIKRRAF